ncbi:hypothetical protein [Agarivorans gilvus]|uniref:hypothetical protein n=1 Tax=Agarivorans gilvus TaxID=680279 RepID=UPI0006EBE578|nr:hypothetical protein [Agarivorans gilvus]
MEGRGVRLRLIAIYLIFKYLVLYCAVGQGFALTATSLSFDEQRITKQKESSPCIIFILCSSLQSDALFKAKLSPH